MYRWFPVSLLLLSVLISTSECRKRENLAGISNPMSLSNLSMCVMVDSQTLGQLSPTKPVRYTLYPITSFNGCKPLPAKAPIKGKMVVEFSNVCTVQQQMEIAKKAGASGLMIIIKYVKDAPYPFKLKLNKPANDSFPILVLTQMMYLRFLNLSSERTDIPIDLRGIPPQPKVTLSFFAFQVIAFLCLVSGGWLSVTGLNGIKYSPMFGSPRPRISHSLNSRCVQRQPSDTNRASSIVTGITCLVFICVSVGMLLLLYFFYDIFVYVFIFFVCIVFSVALKSQVMEIVCRLPKLKNMVYSFTITNKCAKMFIGPEIDLRSIILFPFCTIPVIIWFIYRKDASVVWILQDILGIIACSYVIKTLRFGNLKMITILCVGFFVYDIFMVYITPLFKSQPPAGGVERLNFPLYHSRTKRASGGSVMEDVATGAAGKSGEKLPIMFIFPYIDMMARKIAIPCFEVEFSILGFGDIIIPGIVVAYAYYVDYRLRALTGRCCRYFYALIVIAGYHLGLCLVFVILIAMRTGQPALLTLIPFTILPFVIAAAIRKDLTMIWTGILPSEVGAMEDEILDEEQQRLPVTPK